MDLMRALSILSAVEMYTAPFYPYGTGGTKE